MIDLWVTGSLRLLQSDLDDFYVYKTECLKEGDSEEVAVDTALLQITQDVLGRMAFDVDEVQLIGGSL